MKTNLKAKLFVSKLQCSSHMGNIRFLAKFVVFSAIFLSIWNYGLVHKLKMQEEGIYRVIVDGYRSINPYTTDALIRTNAQDWYNYTKEDLRITEMYQDDANLLRIVRERFLIKPSEGQYNLTQPDIHEHSMGQGEKIREILNNKSEGFFVECGALDGETRSNTLFFERFLGWTGLLIEADPLNFQQVLYKNRRAWLAPTCLSLNRTPTLVNFFQQANLGRIISVDNTNAGVQSAQVLCIPLTTLLLAMDQTKIDYFSLDVEGNELDVLKTIDFDKLDITTLSVEYRHVKEGKEEMERFMDEKGYNVHSIVARGDGLANDFIFHKKK